jgi:TonB family protein
VWVIALGVEAVLPLCSFQVSRMWSQGLLLLFHGWRRSYANGTVRVVVRPGSAVGSARLWLPDLAVRVVIAAYVCVMVYLAARLLWGMWKAHGMMREAQTFKPAGELARAVERCGGLAGHGLTGPELIGLDLDGRGRGAGAVAISARCTGPVTVGVQRRMLLLPVGFLAKVEGDDLCAAVAHEFAHIGRRDYAKNLLYEAISLAVGYHPAVWMTRARVAETREMVCDELAAEIIRGRGSYARALLRLASVLSVGGMTSTYRDLRGYHAIGIFDANILERRVMTMAKERYAIGRVQRFVMVAACGAIALGTCLSAVALRMQVQDPVGQEQGSKPVHVNINDLTILSRPAPVYPAEAKAKGYTVDGEVVLAVRIGKDGAPNAIHVEKGLRGDYDQSALDAVRQWRWKPYLLNGEAVEVDTNITVVYNLGK